MKTKGRFLKENIIAPCFSLSVLAYELKKEGASSNLPFLVVITNN
jgi:hypothetical protein